MRRLELHPLAIEEAAEAAAYTEKERPRYGSLFQEELQRNIRYLRRFPEGGPVVGERVRRRSLKDFSYSIFYAAGDELLYVVAVAHDSRRPGYWRDRLNDIPILG